MTDQQIKCVLMEVQDYMLSQIPKTVKKHEFSLKFRNRMSKIIACHKHPFRYHGLRVATIIMVVFLTACGIFLSMNSKARAEILRWMSERFSNTIWRYSKSSGAEKDISQYGMDGFVPEGYQQIDRIEDETSVSEVYLSEQDELLIFTAISPNYEGDLYFVSDEDGLNEPIVIRELNAEIYLSNIGESNVIVWRNADEILFFIQGMLNKEQLIGIVERLTK